MILVVLKNRLIYRDCYLKDNEKARTNLFLPHLSLSLSFNAKIVPSPSDIKWSTFYPGAAFKFVVACFSTLFFLKIMQFCFGLTMKIVFLLLLLRVPLNPLI